MERRTFLRGSAAAGAAMAALPAEAAATTGETTGRRPLRVQVVLFDGVEEQDFAGPYEVFSAAGMHAKRGTDVSYVCVDGPGVVRAAYGTKVEVERGWSPQDADIIVVPGGGYAKRKGPGIWAEIDRKVLPDALAAAPRKGLTLASLCTGTLLLGAAGLVRGRPCTTHHGAADTLVQQGGLLKKARVVDDGDMVTSGGITSGLDLALWLAKRELGADAAAGLEEMLEYEARGVVWTRG
ncbi:DJ-1/PfpI family protein [Amycolatopsis rubida]|uniref:DJ-1/PfpI family protein n=1 Tax=Amycolatopsis rubida TaxID=112413 RepID=A0ABX0C241_9PSEU|nr:MULTISPECIES: DJ-1/PfpI family protein [Amycolatopsis]MYW94122.1 twin-arginine translocation signal domain-containing protein [Amycolatopsis rubida]NEC59111.1 DJ-1/PfpI family protein [Amycolatopsis rubida]